MANPEAPEAHSKTSAALAAFENIMVDSVSFGFLQHNKVTRWVDYGKSI